MNDLISFIAIFLLLSPIVFGLFYYLIYSPVSGMFNAFSYRNGSLSIDQQTLLANRFKFYSQLDPELKSSFEKRVAFFLNNKKFIPREDIVITDEMKILLAGGAVQLTFGFHKYKMSYFNKIYLLPQSYKLSPRYPFMKGHVSNRGYIMLSWKAIQEGFANPTDGINLVLHELAHALMVSAIEEGENIDFAVDYHVWEEWVKEEMNEQREHTNEKHFFRNYAYTNGNEFFAVAVENFFERPLEFSQSLPQLYLQLTNLLRLDPLNASNPVLIDTVMSSPPMGNDALKPEELFSMIFASPLSFICFVIGALTGTYGTIILFEAFASDTPNAISLVYATLLFSASLFFFVQVFVKVRKK